MTKTWLRSIQIIFVPALLLFAIFARFLPRNKILFGTTPIINNCYWSEALCNIGYDAQTVMRYYFESINKREDFNLYSDELVPKLLQGPILLCKAVAPFFLWCYVLRKAKIVVTSFEGIAFGAHPFWKVEIWLLKCAGIKSIIIPFGADAYNYAAIRDESRKNSLLISYPQFACQAQRFHNRVFYWSKYVDCAVMGAIGTDGMPRWDICTKQPICINVDKWRPKQHYSMANGQDIAVRVLHTPNHKGVKGTEFIIQAIKELQTEGLKVELVLLEGVQNDEVQNIMQTVDILVEQLISINYALSGMEGMSSGLPVLANLSHPDYTQVYRRYSFLNECPILSTTPETIKYNLKLLITRPDLRKVLGVAGRKYVEKYHSYKSAQFMFEAIFKKLDGEDIDLINLYHPLKSEYVMQNRVVHPLINNEYSEQ